MFNQIILYGLAVMILVLSGLLFHAYFLGGSRVRQITKVTDLMRSSLARTQEELAASQTELKSMQLNLNEIAVQLRQRTEVLLDQNLVMTQCKTEIEQLRVGVQELREKLQALQRAEHVQRQLVHDGAQPWSPNAGEKSAEGASVPSAKSESSAGAESKRLQRESISGWRADLDEILRASKDPAARQEK